MNIATVNGRPTITAWDGRTWSLDVAGPGGSITRVTDPAGSTVALAYNGSGDVASIFDGEHVSSGMTAGTAVSYVTPLPGKPPKVRTLRLPGTAHPWLFEYPEGFVGQIARAAYVTDPRGVATEDTLDYQTRTWFNVAGLPIRIDGPRDDLGRWPQTTMLWDKNSNLVCRRTPSANAVRAGCNNPDSPRTDALQTDYAYQGLPPHLLVSEQGPAPNPDGSGERPETRSFYDGEESSPWREAHAEYYRNVFARGLPAAAGFELDLHRDWGAGSPAPVGVTDGWSVRLTGRITIPEGGKRWLRLNAAPLDGVRLVIGSRLIFDCWSDAASCPDEEKRFAAGEKPFVLEFVDRGGDAKAVVKWHRWGDSQFVDVPGSLLRPNVNILTSRRDPAGTTSFSYSAEDKARGRATSQSRGGRTTSYTYDQYGRPLTVTGAAGTVTNTYTGACLSRVVDRAGAVTDYVCDNGAQGPGDVTKVTQHIRAIGQQPAQQRVTQTAYDPLGRVDVVSVGPAGAPLTVITDNDYDYAGRLVKVTEALGRTTDHVHDEAGRLRTERLPDPDGPGPKPRPEIGHEYDLAGNETAIIDARGRRWETGYDSLNRVRLTRDPVGNQTHTVYDSVARTVTVVDPSGVPTVSESDLLGRRVSRRVGTLSPTIFRYDAAGNVVRKTDPAGVWVERMYNSFGQVTRETRPSGPGGAPADTSYDYDAAGRLGGLTDGRGNTTSYTYDAEGRPATVTLPVAANATTIYTYDDAGELVRVVDGENRTRDFAYDALGRQVTTADARGTTRQVYDDASRLLEVLLPTGVVQTFEYDGLDRRVRRYGVHPPETPGGDPRLLDDETFEHDAAGNLVAATNAAGTVAVTYDDAGRILSVAGPGGDTTYEYRNDRLAARTDAAGSTTYEYDRNGQLQTLVDPFGGTTTYSYDGAGRPQARTDPAGLVTSTSYDEAGRVWSETVTRGPQEVAGFELGYDPVGNVTSKDHRVEGVPASENGSWSYAYDPANRLISATDPGGLAAEYGYDGAGNRVSTRIGGGPAVTTSFDGAGHPDSATDGTDYVTDATGTLTEIRRPGQGPEVKEYDTWGRLVGAVTGSNHEVTYRYDALDRTIERTRAGERTTFSYAGITEQVVERHVVADWGTIPEISIPVEIEYVGMEQDLYHCLPQDPDGSDCSLAAWAPREASAGDVAVALVTSLEPPTAGPPGWKLVRHDANATYHMTAWVHVLTEEEASWDEYPPTFEWEFDAATKALMARGDYKGYLSLLVYSNVNRDHPIFASSGEVLQNADDQSATDPARAPSIGALPGSRIVYASAWTSGTSGLVPPPKDGPSEMTERLPYAGAQRAWVFAADEARPRGGDTGDREATYHSDPPSASFGQLINLTPAGIDPGAEFLEFTTTYAHGPDGPLGERTNQALRYYVADLHDDVVGLANAGGEMRGTVSFSPWGEVRSRWSEESLFGFQGAPTDPATGAVDMITRNYEPTLGRFTTRDTVFGNPMMPMSLNQFTYGLGNPVTLTDPDGMCPDPAACPPMTGPAGTKHSEEFISRINNGGHDPNPLTHSPRPLQLNLPLRRFERMLIPRRRVWLNWFQSRFSTQGWFNAQGGVLDAFDSLGIAAPGSWASTVDAAILHGIQNGMALYIGLRSEGNNPSGYSWAGFFNILFDPARDDSGRRFVWATAEAKGTFFGVRRAGNRGMVRTIGEHSILEGSRLFRQVVAGIDIAFGLDALCIDRLFGCSDADPRNSRFANEMTRLVYLTSTVAGDPECAGC